MYRSAECLAKLAPSQPSQDKRFVKTKNSFKVRLRTTQAPAPVPSPYTKLVVKLKPPVIAERTESGNSGGRRELDEQKGRLVFKLKLPSSSSAQEGPGACLDRDGDDRNLDKWLVVCWFFLPLFHILTRTF